MLTLDPESTNSFTGTPPTLTSARGVCCRYVENVEDMAFITGRVILLSGHLVHPFCESFCDIVDCVVCVLSFRLLLVRLLTFASIVRQMRGSSILFHMQGTRFDHLCEATVHRNCDTCWTSFLKVSDDDDNVYVVC